MFRPIPPQGDPGSYVDLLKRMTRRVQSGTEDRLISMMELALDDALARENVVLARAERTRLFRQISRAVLEAAAARIEGGKADN